MIFSGKDISFECIDITVGNHFLDNVTDISASLAEEIRFEHHAPCFYENRDNTSWHSRWVASDRLMFGQQVNIFQ